MANKPAEKLYPLTSSQRVCELQERYSLKKSVDNIPFILTFKNPIDFDVMQQALDIELTRNDCMRMRGYREKGKLFTYFRKEVKYTALRVDFTGKTKEQQEAFYQKQSNTPVNYIKENAFRVIFINGYDGKSVIYFLHHHVFNDTMGILIEVEDLINIYHHLKNGGEMPKPLPSYEEYVAKSLSADIADKKEADKVFFTEYYKSTGCPAAIAPYSGRLLDDFRKKKKDPTLRYAKVVALIGKSGFAKMEITGERGKRVMEICDRYKVSPQNFFYMMIRLQASVMNHGESCMYNSQTAANRPKVADKRMPGVTLISYGVQTNYPADMKLSDALVENSRMFNELYRHTSMDMIETIALQASIYPYPQMHGYNVNTVSAVPFGMDVPEEMDCDLDWLPPQTLPSPMFTVIGFNVKKNSVRLFQHYHLSFVKHEEVTAMFKNYQKIVDLMCEDPEATLGEIIAKV